jgi:hypothetical protein
MELASKLGARAFNIPMSTWNNMPAEEQWRANVEFLDEAIAAGERIILATPPEKIPAILGFSCGGHRLTYKPPVPRHQVLRVIESGLHSTQPGVRICP